MCHHCTSSNNTHNNNNTPTHTQQTNTHPSNSTMLLLQAIHRLFSPPTPPPLFIDLLPPDIRLRIAKYVVESSLGNNALTLLHVSPTQRHVVLSLLHPSVPRKPHELRHYLLAKWSDVLVSPTVPLRHFADTTFDKVLERGFATDLRIHSHHVPDVYHLLTNVKHLCIEQDHILSPNDRFRTALLPQLHSLTLICHHTFCEHHHHLPLGSPTLTTLNVVCERGHKCQNTPPPLDLSTFPNLQHLQAPSHLLPATPLPPLKSLHLQQQLHSPLHLFPLASVLTKLEIHAEVAFAQAEQLVHLHRLTHLTLTLQPGAELALKAVVLSLASLSLTFPRGYEADLSFLTTAPSLTTLALFDMSLPIPDLHTLLTPLGPNLQSFSLTTTDHPLAPQHYIVVVFDLLVRHTCVLQKLDLVLPIVFELWPEQLHLHQVEAMLRALDRLHRHCPDVYIGDLERVIAQAPVSAEWEQASTEGSAAQQEQEQGGGDAHSVSAGHLAEAANGGGGGEEQIVSTSQTANSHALQVLVHVASSSNAAANANANIDTQMQTTSNAAQLDTPQPSPTTATPATPAASQNVPVLSDEEIQQLDDFDTFDATMPNMRVVQRRISELYNHHDLYFMGRIHLHGCANYPRNTLKAVNYLHSAISEGSFDAVSLCMHISILGYKDRTASLKAQYETFKVAIDSFIGNVQYLIDLARGLNDTTIDGRWAIKAYEVAIREHKSTQAMVDLAKMHSRGYNSVPPNPTGARKWLEMGIAHGCSTAMNNLGVMMENGYEGQAPDHAAAKRLYEQAVEVGEDTVSMSNLASLLADGYDDIIPDYPEAVRLYRRAIEEGDNLDAMRNLAFLLREGYVGVKANIAEACELFRRAAENECYTSMNELGLILEEGYDDVKADHAAAISYYLMAIEEGANFVSMFNLGVLYVTGYEGQAPDFTKAVFYLERSVEVGEYVNAMWRLFQYYRAGYDEVAADREKAYAMFERAFKLETCATDLCSLAYDLAFEYNPPDKASALRLYVKALEKGDVKQNTGCYVDVAIFFEQCFDEHPANAKGALELYRQVAETGGNSLDELFATRKIGEILERGYDGMAGDYETAVGWYRKAVGMKEAGARTFYRWALALEKGFGGGEGDVEAAVGMLRKSVDGGEGDFGEAYLKLAELVEEADGREARELREMGMEVIWRTLDINE